MNKTPLSELIDYAFLLGFLILRTLIDYWRDWPLFFIYRAPVNLNAILSIALLLWAISLFYRAPKALRDVPAFPAMALFLLFSAGTFIYSRDRVSTIIEILRALNIFAVFCASYILFLRYRANYRRHLLTAIAISAAAPLLMAGYQFAARAGLSADDIPNRLFGTFAHPNLFATFCLVLFIIWFQEFLVKTADSRQTRALYQYAIGIMLIIFVGLSYTRVSWLGLAAFLLVTGFFYFRRQLIVGLLCVAAFYAIFYPLNGYLMDNYNIKLQNNPLIARLTARNEDTDSIGWRLGVYQKTLWLAASHPIIGQGYGSFPKVWEANKDRRNLYDVTSQAHNDYLRLLFETGAIGLSLYLLIFVILIYRQIKIGIQEKWRNNITLLSALLVFLALSASDNMLQHTPTLLILFSVLGMWVAEEKYPLSGHPFGVNFLHKKAPGQLLRK